MLNTLMTVLASSERTGGSFTLIEQALTPDGNPPPHVHSHEDEAFYVLDGEVEVSIGADDRVLRAGDFAYAARGVRHGYRVVSPAARLLVLATPGGIETFFREIGEPAAEAVVPPPKAPDAALVGAAAQRHGITIHS